MKVYIIAQEDGDDILCKVVAEGKSSDVRRLKGKAQLLNGNPYGVYGDLVQDITGVDKYSTNIIVARVSSGELREG